MIFACYCVITELEFMMIKSLSGYIVESHGKGLHKEFIRKSIHLLIATIPILAEINFNITIGLLTSGILVYSYSETLRCSGRDVYLISNLTLLAARERDRNKFVLGPVTLGIGALLTLMLYPNPAATIGIYALAFGDGLSSIFGKLFGKTKLPFSGGKTIVGSLTCFTAVFFTSFRICNDAGKSFILATTATFIEMLPIKDFDNLFIPVGTGLLAFFLIPF